MERDGAPGRVSDQVMPQGGERATTIVIVAGERVAGEERVQQDHRARASVRNTSRISRDGAVKDCGRSTVEEAVPLSTRDGTVHHHEDAAVQNAAPGVRDVVVQGAGAEQEPTAVLDPTALPLQRRVVCKGAAVDRHRALVIDPAADGTGVNIFDEGAVRERRRAAILQTRAAGVTALIGVVLAHDAVAERQRPQVQQALATATARSAPLQGEPLDRQRSTGRDVQERKLWHSKRQLKS